MDRYVSAMPTNHDPVTANVRAEMARHEKTQTDVAAILGMSQNGVSRRLRGQTAWRLSELRALAAALDVPLTALVRDDTAGAA